MKSLVYKAYYMLPSLHLYKMLTKTIIRPYPNFLKILSLGVHKRHFLLFLNVFYLYGILLMMRKRMILIEYEKMINYLL